jgi:regulator of sigma D
MKTLLHQAKPQLFPRADIDNLIKQWLKHRQEVLVHYSQVCVEEENKCENLAEFCEVMMDYVAIGHFKIFEKLAEFHQSSQPSKQDLDAILLKKIQLTTDAVLDFNDKYTDLNHLDQLTLDLSHLGESLANRMDWEDEFIQYCLKFAQ